MSTFRLLATNTVAQTVTKVATVFTTLIISRMIASPEQGLGRAGYEDFGIIVAFAAYFYMVTDFGFNAVAAKDITDQPDKTSSYVNNLLSLRLALSAVLCVVGLLILAFVDYKISIKIGILLSLVTIFSQSLITNSNLVFQVRLQYWQATFAVVIGSLASLVIATYAYMTHSTLLTYVLASLAGSVIMGLLSVWLVHRTISIQLQFDRQLWRYLFVAALPLGLAVILNVVYIRAGFFILSLHTAQTDQAYGLLSAAYRIFDVALVIPVFVVNALYPIMLSRLQHQPSHFKKLFVKALGMMMGISIVVAGLIWLLAPLAIDLTTNNSQFAQSVILLRWLCLIIPVFFLTNLLLWAIIALGQRKSVVIIYGIGALISIIANLWLVPIYSYWAVISITGITEAIIGLLLIIQLLIIWRRPSSFRSASDDTTSILVSNMTQDEAIV